MTKFDRAVTKGQDASQGREIQARVAAISDLLKANAREAEELGHLPDATVKALYEAGVYGMGIPVELGGSALGAREQVDILLEIGRSDGAAGWSSAVATTQWFIFAYPQQAIDEFFAGDWIGPRLAGATFSVSHAVATARKVPGGWMVKGEWSFGSNCWHSRWFAAGVQFDDGNGGKRRGQALLSREQYTIKDDWHVMGLQGTGSNSVVAAEEVFVPEHRLIPLEALGAVLMRDLSDRFPAGLMWRINRLASLGLCGSGVPVGMAYSALRAFIEQAKKNKAFNLPYRTISEAPTVQAVAAKAHTMISAAEALVYRDADILDELGTAGRPMSFEQTAALTMDASFIHRLCNEAVDMLQLTIGSRTASLSNSIQKYMRDIRVMSLHGGLRWEFNAENFGRALFDLPPHPSFLE